MVLLLAFSLVITDMRIAHIMYTIILRVHAEDKTSFFFFFFSYLTLVTVTLGRAQIVERWWPSETYKVTCTCTAALVLSIESVL